MAILRRRRRALVLARAAALDRWPRSPSACIVGLPSLRLRADYFAIATIASAEVVRIVAQNAARLTGGNQGIFGYDDDRLLRRLVATPSTSSTSRPARTSAGPIPRRCRSSSSSGSVAVLLVVVALRLTQSTPWGRVLRAIREDEDAARALGKNAFSYKLQSLAIAAALGAIAGCFLALNLDVRLPGRVRADRHLHRLRGADPRRARQLLGRRSSARSILWTLLEGHPLPRPADRRRQVAACGSSSSA